MSESLVFIHAVNNFFGAQPFTLVTIYYAISVEKFKFIIADFDKAFRRFRLFGALIIFC